ncbi:MAG: hypothetical protein LBI95_01905 [Holosporales bacterium]|jgi:glucose-6-phosphate isomerase|nr:hypothetical protein [Holosporales bacterium]
MNETFKYIKRQIETLDIFKVVNEDRSHIKTLAKRFDDCDKVLVIGTGGSSLGGKCITSFSSMLSGSISKVTFLENIDSLHFSNVIKNCNPKSTGVIVISKSGKTTEQLMLLLTLYEIWKRFDWNTRALAITELSENNDLRLFAKSKKIPVIECASTIGGRFSVFSIVGLLPAILSGVDIDKFVNGAKRVMNNFLKAETVEKCELFRDIVSMYKVFKDGNVDQYVLMMYSDMLEEYGKWFVQLISESLGKSRNFGITPLRAIGTIDQHSMMQLFLAGPSNKFFTIVTQRNNLETPRINPDVDSNIINSLKNHNLNDLMISHQKATIETLKKKAAVRVLEFDQFDIENLGILMMTAFIEVISIAKFADINPFDQPAVEQAKMLVFEYLKQ